MQDFGDEEARLICVDFDGTLTKGNVHSWDEGVEEPREEVIEWVNEKYFDGHHIVIWTARGWSCAQHIAAWCMDHGVRFHGIRCCKGGSDVYVDDKAVTPEDATDYPDS